MQRIYRIRLLRIFFYTVFTMKIALFSVLTLFLFVSDYCKNDFFESMNECDQAMLERFDMVPTVNSNFGCRLSLCAYELEGETYYGIHSPCAGIVVNPVRCDGSHYSERIAAAEQAYFFAHARLLRHIGVEK